MLIRHKRCQWHWVSESNRKELRCPDAALHLYKKKGPVYKVGKASMWSEGVYNLCDFHNVLLPLVSN